MVFNRGSSASLLVVLLAVGCNAQTTPPCNTISTGKCRNIGTKFYISKMPELCCRPVSPPCETLPGGSWKQVQDITITTNRVCAKVAGPQELYDGTKVNPSDNKPSVSPTLLSQSLLCKTCTTLGPHFAWVTKVDEGGSFSSYCASGGCGHLPTASGYLANYDAQKDPFDSEKTILKNTMCFETCADAPTVAQTASTAVTTSTAATAGGDKAPCYRHITDVGECLALTFYSYTCFWNADEFTSSNCECDWVEPEDCFERDIITTTTTTTSHALSPSNPTTTTTTIATTTTGITKIKNSVTTTITTTPTATYASPSVTQKPPRKTQQKMCKYTIECGAAHKCLLRNKDGVGVCTPHSAVTPPPPPPPPASTITTATFSSTTSATTRTGADTITVVALDTLRSPSALMLVCSCISFIIGGILVGIKMRKRRKLANNEETYHSTDDSDADDTASLIHGRIRTDMGISTGCSLPLSRLLSAGNERGSSNVGDNRHEFNDPTPDLSLKRIVSTGFDHATHRRASLESSEREGLMRTTAAGAFLMRTTAAGDFFSDVPYDLSSNAASSEAEINADLNTLLGATVFTEGVMTSSTSFPRQWSAAQSASSPSFYEDSLEIAPMPQSMPAQEFLAMCNDNETPPSNGAMPKTNFAMKTEMSRRNHSLFEIKPEFMPMVPASLSSLGFSVQPSAAESGRMPAATKYVARPSLDLHVPSPSESSEYPNSSEESVCSTYYEVNAKVKESPSSSRSASSSPLACNPHPPIPATFSVASSPSPSPIVPAWHSPSPSPTSIVPDAPAEAAIEVKAEDITDQSIKVRDPQGEWSTWALELRAAARNKAVKVFHLTDSEAGDLKIQGRRWKQGTAQRKYLAKARTLLSTTSRTVSKDSEDRKVVEGMQHNM